MEDNTLLKRVENELKTTSKSRKDLVIDHLIMAHSHLFEEFKGENIAHVLSDINYLISKIGKAL